MMDSNDDTLTSHPCSGLLCTWYFVVAYKYVCDLLHGLVMQRSLRRARHLVRPTMMCCLATAAFVVEAFFASAWQACIADVAYDARRTPFDSLLMFVLPQILIAGFSAFLFVLSTVAVDLSCDRTGDVVATRRRDAIATFAVMYLGTS